MRLAVLAVAAALAGCVLLEPGSDPSGVDAAVQEAIGAARAPDAERKAALELAEERFGRDATPLNRLRLATLLATLPRPLRDDARAAALLEPIANAGSPGPGRFAAFLSGQLAERRRLAGEIERLAREAERAARERERLERERERLEHEHERAEKERDKREEALRQQLEALRSIERSILEREDKLRRRQRKP